MSVTLNLGERIDDLHRNGYKIIQNKTLFCFGQDAVLLSSFAKAKRNETALDLCAGNGIVSILMCAKNSCERYDALEIQPESASLAKRSVELNGLSRVINVTEGDLKNAANIYAGKKFNVITVNPPYMKADGGYLSESNARSAARAEILCVIEDVINVSSKLLTFGGRFYMIHRPNRIVDIFYYMRLHRIEPKVMRLVTPKKGGEPTMVLIEGVSGGNAFLKVLPELVIYDSNGSYTDEVRRIYYE